MSRSKTRLLPRHPIMLVRCCLVHLWRWVVNRAVSNLRPRWERLFQLLPHQFRRHSSKACWRSRRRLAAVERRDSQHANDIHLLWINRWSSTRKCKWNLERPPHASLITNLGQRQKRFDERRQRRLTTKTTRKWHHCLPRKSPTNSFHLRLTKPFFNEINRMDSGIETTPSVFLHRPRHFRLNPLQIFHFRANAFESVGNPWTIVRRPCQQENPRLPEQVILPLIVLRRRIKATRHLLKSERTDASFSFRSLEHENRSSSIETAIASATDVDLREG